MLKVTNLLISNAKQIVVISGGAQSQILMRSQWLILNTIGIHDYLKYVSI
jgi:hypothetical protein